MRFVTISRVITERFQIGLNILRRLYVFGNTGRSKAGGPAARFVMETFNPVESFAKRELGIKLRPKARKPITEEGAGDLIHQVKKAIEIANRGIDGP